MRTENTHFDTVIIGGGPAGLSAAMWCEDMGLDTLLIEGKNEFGGQLNRVYNLIENHLGSDVVDGAGLCRSFLRQVENRAFERRSGTGVARIDPEGKTVFLENAEAIKARAVIIATGVSRRRLGIEGETEFRGRGLIESGKKDPEIAARKEVLIIGGGDAAVENALILSEKAKKVTVVHRRDHFTARSEFLDKAKETANIELLTGWTLAKISGAEKIEEVDLVNTGTGAGRSLPAEVVLIRIGVEPNSKIFTGYLETDEDGYIVVNARCETSLEGIFAIGDVANPLAPTVSTAVGTGATAARCIYDYLVHTHQLDR